MFLNLGSPFPLPGPGGTLRDSRKRRHFLELLSEGARLPVGEPSR